MGKYDFIKIKKKLSKYLDEARFEHTMGVMYTCAALAMVYDYDLEDAQAAGLLHDSAKCIPNKKKLKLCSQHDIPVSDFEKDHPFLLRFFSTAVLSCDRCTLSGSGGFCLFFFFFQFFLNHIIAKGIIIRNPLYFLTAIQTEKSSFFNRLSTI